MLITDTDHQRISAAIAAAEETTSGEIFTILEKRRPRYPQVAMAVAIIVALALPIALLVAGVDFDVPWLTGWQAGAPDPRRAIEVMTALQTLTFVAVMALLWATPLGLWLTPRAIRRDRVHAEAVAQFLSKGLHVTRARTGVLIYVSLHDHVAEVIADEGIYAKVPPETWGDVTAALVAEAAKGRLADGFVEAIAATSRILAAHFPPGAQNPDELPNVLVEL